MYRRWMISKPSGTALPELIAYYRTREDGVRGEIVCSQLNILLETNSKGKVEFFELIGLDPQVCLGMCAYWLGWQYESDSDS